MLWNCPLCVYFCVKTACAFYTKIDRKWLYIVYTHIYVCIYIYIYRDIYIYMFSPQGRSSVERLIGCRTRSRRKPSACFRTPPQWSGFWQTERWHMRCGGWEEARLARIWVRTRCVGVALSTRVTTIRRFAEAEKRTSVCDKSNRMNRVSYKQ